MGKFGGILLYPTPCSSLSKIIFNFSDLSRYERLINDHADLQTLIDITHELFPLEVIGKILCSLLEVFISLNSL